MTSTLNSTSIGSVLLLPPARDSSSSISVLTAMLWFSLWIFFKIMNYVVVIVPTIFLNVMSVNYQITLSVSSILITLVVIVGICFIIVRYKYLTGYSKNTKPKDAKPNHKDLDLVGDMKKKPSKSASNYLDEFLSAIKVFGYLERPVFHELTKNMTTQRLLADELLYMDEHLGFSIVVEGTIQVFTKVNELVDDLVSQQDDEDRTDMLIIGNQRYQLLNEVKSGAPLLSLMNTLDLFKPLFSNMSSFSLLSPNRTFHDDLSTSPLDRVLSTSLAALVGLEIPSQQTVYPEIVARPKPQKKRLAATVTIAIIPYSAFQRVQARYPKATSHIVTMVLTRLYKVTMNTVHNYLGLTQELLESEVKLNQATSDTKLPSYLHDGIIDRFYGSQSSDFGKRPLNKHSASSRHLARSSSRYVVLDLRSKSSHPGDLLSSVPLSRKSDLHDPNVTASPDRSRLHDIRGRDFSDEREETEETSLRIAVVENIFKLMGVDETHSEITESSPSSGLSSEGLSVVGLSSLMNSTNDVSKTNIPAFAEFQHSVYDSATGRIRLDSFGSPNSRPLSPTPHKVYNTISQQKLKQCRDPGALAALLNNALAPAPKRRSTNPHKHELSFNNVKSEFGKYLEFKVVPPNSVVVEQDSFNSGIYYVIDGSLDVVHETSSKDPDSQISTKKKVYTVNEGGLAGYLCSVVGFRSLVSIKTPKNKGAIVAHIAKSDYTKLMDKFYFLQLPVASRLKSLLSKEMLMIDYALEWCHIPAGGVLFSQDDVANGFHIVLSGRFRVVRYDNTKTTDDVHDYNDNLIDELHTPQQNKENFTVLGEYGHGESIGEVEVLTASRRTNSLIAVRDSETARIPRTLFEMLSIQNPAIMVKVSRIVARRMMELKGSNPYAQTSISPIPTSTVPHISNEYKTITILPTVSGLPVREFADKLVQALKTIGRNVIALDQASTLTHLGRHAFDERLAQLKLSGYFAYLEEEYQTIVYVCDTPLKSNWTSTCISQGDCILLLADAEDDEVAINVGDYERLLIKLKTTARTDLCLIHPDKYVIPGSTSIWLKNRMWVRGHHHIQMEIPRDKKERKKKVGLIGEIAAKISSRTNPNIKLRLENVRLKAISSLDRLNRRLNRGETMEYKSVLSHKNDFLRLARILSNEAVGLVLGGGGSRGISHVGVVMALEKHGIPVDLIGGTSIGSFVGGLYALDYNIVSIYGRAKKFAKRVSSLWRQALDLTYPVTSYITGYEFNRGIWKLFGFNEVEDFWIKYFCNTTNITNSTMDVHESGYAWRFIRASMSLAGLLPPIAYDGCMILDGGYLDNLPVMEMKKKGAKYIIAVDVGSVDDRTPMNYGDTLSGFWVLFNRWNPFSKHPNVPNMMDIQMRLAYVASVNALELAKKTPGVIYLRPPIDNYATLDFAKFDEIYHVGLAYADELFTKWQNSGKMPPIAGMVDKRAPHGIRPVLYRRNSI